MSTPPPAARPDQPHLVSLVLQSKKALQHGEQLCTRANSVSNASAQCAVDVLALDAKVRWITDAVLEQLQLAATVARSIEQKRAQLDTRVNEWDNERIRRTDALDSILESLGSQFVPPEFHQPSCDSSLFGSQHSASPPHHSPTGTVRICHTQRKADRSKWKTLRDFVDERAIEDALETMEDDRTALEDILATTSGYPETLHHTINTIRDSLPVTETLSIGDVITSQEKESTKMAEHLESLASHYEQMASALRESEAGEVFSDEDLHDMNRDTEELPSIMAELEESMVSIDLDHERLFSAKASAEHHLSTHNSVLDDLEELGDIMTDMLVRQQSIETDSELHLAQIQQHLLTLEELHHRYLLYQASFDKLLIEVARRRQYREAAENIVKDMVKRLDAMTEDERQLRDEFREEHGAHLPDDICLCIENPPTKWEILPFNGDCVESLPDIDDDLLVKAKERIANTEGILPGSGSL